MKEYSTRKIRAVLLMFNAMVNNYEMDYELFNDYTGLKTYSYRNVKRIIREMISDLNLHFNFISISIINITKKTKYYTYKYCLESIGELKYSYHICDDLDDEKLINYSMTITVPKMLIEQLKEYKIWQDNHKLLMGDLYEDSDRVFTNLDGKLFNPDLYNTWLDKVLIEAGLKHYTLHSIRHTNITLQIAAGVPLVTVSARAGHARTSTTTDIYAHALKSTDNSF